MRVPFLIRSSKKNDELLGLTNVVSGRLDVATVNSLSWDATATLSYNRNIKKHNLNFLDWCECDFKYG